MITHSQYIYTFVDKFLKIAMECSICKENYMMVDDTIFLDEYMKVFHSFLQIVDEDDQLKIEELELELEQKGNLKIQEFKVFLQQQAINRAIESVKSKPEGNNLTCDSQQYIEAIRKNSDLLLKNLVDSDLSPVELLEEFRKNEIQL
ncbi:MAG: hypothetical protein R3Y24_10490 [Eubacteriales bacterium]